MDDLCKKDSNDKVKRLTAPPTTKFPSSSCLLCFFAPPKLAAFSCC
jgi:hypothetical protein